MSVSLRKVTANVRIMRRLNGEWQDLGIFDRAEASWALEDFHALDEEYGLTEVSSYVEIPLPDIDED